MSRYQFPAQATTDASLLVSGTLADARLSANVALENVANTFTAKQSFSGTDHVGLCLLSLTTAQYNALTPANGDLFVDSTTDRVNARLARGTVELNDSSSLQLFDDGIFWFPKQSKSLTSSIGPSPTFIRSTIAKFMQSNGVWADAAINTPAFHHVFNGGVVESAGLLLEPARTNLVIRSGELTNASWTKNNVTVALVTSPDSTNNAVSVTESTDGAATFHRLYVSAAVAAASTYTFSVFYKPATNGRFRIQFVVVGAAFACDVRFDLTSLIADTQFSNGFTASVVPYPDGWYRLIATGPSVNAGSPLLQIWLMSPSGATNYQGDGRLAGQLWAPQLELGLDATNPIITAAATVLRAAPSLTFDNLSMGESGMIVATTIMSPAAVGCNLFSIDDATGNNFIRFSRAANGTFNANITSGGASSFSNEFTKIIETNEEVTSGISFSTTDTVSALKGTTGAADTAVVFPTSLTRLTFDPAINGCLGLVRLFSKRTFNANFVRLTGDAGFVAPDDAALNYSDFCVRSTTSIRTILSRSYVSGNYEHSAPGARLRFNCSHPEIVMRFTSETPDGASQNGTCTVLVNGVEFKTIATVSSSGTEWTVSLKGAGNRLIEFIWPTARRLTFLGINTYGPGSITAPVARPTTTICCVGDSTTHGFNSSKSTKAWPYLLAGLKNWQILNMGYGSAVIDASLGTIAANLNPNVCVYLIGYNNFTAQTPLATFKSTMNTFVTNFRAIQPNTKLYLGGPFYTPNTNTLTPSMYRTQVSDLVTTLADANTIFVNTLAATTNSLASFPDGIHPNDAGSIEIANYLNGVIE